MMEPALYETHHKSSSPRWTRALLILAGSGIAVGVGMYGVVSSGHLPTVRGMLESFQGSRDGIPLAEIQREIINAFEAANFSGTLMEADQNRARHDFSPGVQRIPYYDEQRRRIVAEATMNADRYRGRPVALEKPDGVTRVIAIGDSYTFGYAIDDDQTYAVRLEMHDRHCQNVTGFGTIDMHRTGQRMHDSEAFTRRGPRAGEFIRIQIQVQRVAANEYDALAGVYTRNHWNVRV